MLTSKTMIVDIENKKTSNNMICIYDVLIKYPKNNFSI